MRGQLLHVNFQLTNFSPAANTGIAQLQQSKSQHLHSVARRLRPYPSSEGQEQQPMSPSLQQVSAVNLGSDDIIRVTQSIEETLIVSSLQQIPGNMTMPV
ncbi:hypothetical protein J3459_010983 [Metarhizium acridum]|uniref:uncharacterized protein n=1 Tax=Metarhizium acridum TaxID=92637 RepID=UPI001C6AE823|nr:hypothetical protein J3458_019777 [Metarhizium acridum]KAG8420526.1 hypothetical protein J3459_010983 [Metarhizium acridum]